MKRFLVSCVIYAIFACNILAQTQMNRSYLYNRGYKANIQASVLFANNSELRFVQHEHTLKGASPQTTLIVGRLQPKARVSAARRNLKEAGGKHLV